MDTFSFDDIPQMLLQLGTLVNVFLLLVVPQPKLYFEITHLIGVMRVKSLIGRLPGVCILCPAAAFIPKANCFHPGILASLCHLALLKALSIHHWHLVKGSY